MRNEAGAKHSFLENFVCILQIATMNFNTDTVMKDNRTNCDACEASFERNIENMVDEVEGYDREDHYEKREEVRQAFHEKPGRDSDRK